MSSPPPDPMRVFLWILVAIAILIFLALVVDVLDLRVD